MRRLVCAVLVACVAVVALPETAAGESAYAPPVDGPIVDPFRPPVTPYGPGNRGIDYATAPGADVVAAADGEVVFAGRVGLSRHVVVLHPDGIRTSYSFLASIAVRRGDRVRRGDVVGTSAGEVHFGARAGDDRYLDPLALLGGDAPAVHLIPVAERRAGSERHERFNLVRSLGGVTIRAAAAGVRFARDQVVQQAEVVAHYAQVPQRLVTTVRRNVDVLLDQRGCTPASTPVARRRPGRRIAVLVGGFGSTSEGAAIDDVDTERLGYGRHDVARFSYRGGQVPGRRTLVGVPITTYGHADSEGDVGAAGSRLRTTLEEVAAAHPGVPIDLIAHSQGGLVVRAALAGAGASPVEHVITLGTPHHGSDLATANQAIGTSAAGRLLQFGTRLVTGGEVDPFSAAAGQLAETSSFVDDIDDADLPPGTDVRSIAAAGDLVVPVPAAQLDGATNTIIPLHGVTAHDRLPGSAAARREIALALAGQGPTCRNLIDDILIGDGISLFEDGIGATAALLGLGS